MQGLPESDPAKHLIKDYISEIIIEKGGFSIISDDEVQQVMKSEELKMSLDVCYDDACIKKLMQSIKTDYIIYGSISLVDKKYFITAKILDRTSGSVVLARVKTIKFTKRDWIEKGSKALGEFIVTGSDVALKEFENYISGREVDTNSPNKLVGRKNNIVGRAPFIRLARAVNTTLADSTLNDVIETKNQTFTNNIFLDLFLWRERNVNGNGFDFFSRGVIQKFDVKNNKQQEWIILMMPKDPTATDPRRKLDTGEMISNRINIGTRYITGFYIMGVQWQAYISGAYQYMWGETSAGVTGSGILNGMQKSKSNTSPFGILGGAGIEIGFSSYFGAFIEGTYGYNPVEIFGKKRNVDGYSVYSGVTLRTSYGDN